MSVLGKGIRAISRAAKLYAERLFLDDTEVTASAAELNILDGVTATAAELNLNDGTAASITLAVGAEAANVIRVSGQVKDGNGVNLAVRTVITWFLASSASTLAVSAAPAGGIAVGTAGVLIEWTTDVAGVIVTDATGAFNVDITDTNTPTFYLVCILPTGVVTVSAAITFA